MTRWEWGHAGRPIPTELHSGDQVTVQEGDERLFAAVIDGLGHGPGAHRAAQAILVGLEDSLSRPLEEALRKAHRQALATRGAAVSAVVVDTRVDRLTWAGVGNVEGVLLNPGEPVRERLLVQGGIVGQRLPRRLRIATLPIRRGDVLVLGTDGLASAFTDDPVLRSGRHPRDLARSLLETHGKRTDDAMVWVLRYRGG